MPATVSSDSSKESSKETPTLRKGLACLACRKKKTRCDGKRPACGTCSKSSKSAIRCEYADQTSTARAQQLEEEVVFLQARIEELERMADPFFIDSTREREGVAMEWNGLEKSLPPSDVLARLVHNFLQRSHEFGMFMDKQRLGVITYCAVCRNAIFLWAVHLAGPDSPWFKTAPVFLSRALAFLTTGIVGHCGDQSIVCQLQGIVLLATYYSQTGKFFDARSQLSAACSLIYDVGLHRIGATSHPPPFGYVGPPVGSYNLTLTPGQEPIEATERHRCFWTVMTLSNIWTGMDDVPNFFDFEMLGSEVTTPWPDLEEGSYDLGIPVVQQFLKQQPDNATSLNALIAKSALLFSKAAQVSQKYRPGMSNIESTALFAEFMDLDTAVENFAMSLQFEPDAPIARVILARSLTSASTIKLHRRYASVAPISRQKCIMAAKTIASFTTIDPAATLDEGHKLQDRALWKIWVMAIEVLIADLDSMDSDPGRELNKGCVVGMIDSLLKIVAKSVYACPRAQTRYEELRDIFVAITLRDHNTAPILTSNGITCISSSCSVAL